MLRDVWWNVDDEHVYSSLFDTKKSIEQSDAGRLENYRDCLQVFWNLDTVPLEPKDAPEYRRRFPENNIALNVIYSACDSIMSKITGYKPRPMFLTTGGDYEIKQRAKQLEKFIDGVFYKCKVYEEARKMLLDAIVMGTGILKTSSVENDIVIERVIPSDIYVDTQACITAAPRSIIQRKFISSEALSYMFRDDKSLVERIELSGRDQRGTIVNNSVVLSDLVEVLEGWHLPSGKDATDGKHVIAIDSTTLFVEEYKKNYLPFVFYKWSQPNTSFWGMGAVEQVMTEQQELNKLLRRIQGAMHVCSVPRLFVEEGSLAGGVEHIRNEIGDVVEYKPGTKIPEMTTPPSMNSEVFNYIVKLKNDIYENLGISQLSAAGLKPAGVESGVAMRTLQDIETSRYSQEVEKWGETFIEIAHHVVDIASDIYRHNPDYKVKYVSSRFIESIKWEDVNMDEDDYVLRVYPVNILPSTPAGKLATVQDLIQGGFIDQSDALSLLDFPDLDKWQSVESANADLVEKIIYEIIVNGNKIQPEPYMDLEYAIRKVTLALVKAQIDNVPRNRKQMLVEWVSDAQDLIDSMQQAAMPQELPPMSQEGVIPNVGTAPGLPGAGIPVA